MKEIQVGDLVFFKNHQKSTRMIVFKLMNNYEGFPLASVRNRVVDVMILSPSINKCFPIKIYESSLTLLKNEDERTDYI